MQLYGRKLSHFFAKLLFSLIAWIPVGNPIFLNHSESVSCLRPARQPNQFRTASPAGSALHHTLVIERMNAAIARSLAFSSICLSWRLENDGERLRILVRDCIGVEFKTSSQARKREQEIRAMRLQFGHFNLSRVGKRAHSSNQPTHLLNRIPAIIHGFSHRHAPAPLQHYYDMSPHTIATD